MSNEVICIWSSWCHCHPSSLVSLKCRMVLPFWYQLTQVVLEHTQTFYGPFCRTTWVSRQQKGKPFWILLKQEKMGWQWHQLGHMQIICTTLQTDNLASTPSLNFLWAGCVSWRPPNSVKALKVLHVVLEESPLNGCSGVVELGKISWGTQCGKI